jgi:tRNA threonylcarbamoyladenosine biosynthesis protein TsaE
VNPPVLRLATTSVQQTQALAAALSALAEAGDLIVLSGEMGAGKTAFTQGFARGLGITEAVTSPTFTIVREHTGGRLNLHHLDVYRLDHLREVGDLGLAEMLEEDAVMLVEWGDVVLPALGDDRLEVALSLVDATVDAPADDATDDHRRLEIRARGGRWQARHRALTETLAEWTSETDPC